MNDKTLVERLRDEAKRAREERDLPVYAPETIEELANAIEREYMPRPLFEDGEPVKEGDTICIDGHLPLKVYSWSVRNDGLTVFSCPTSHRSIKTGERVKRQEPVVLDADGVPIKVGDTVYVAKEHWTAEIGNEAIVESIKNGIVYTSDDGAWSGDYLSHEQPDTLGRIESDAVKLEYIYWECGDEDCPDCHSPFDGKNPKEHYGVDSCAKAMRLDLLRRQREVLERGR